MHEVAFNDPLPAMALLRATEKELTVQPMRFEVASSMDSLDVQGTWR